jgi:hypothetical protein
MLERVRKLLAKAEDPGCTPEEAALLNDKAAELIARYGVDQALLAAGRPEVDPIGDRVIQIDAPYALDKVFLLGMIGTQLRCRSVRKRQWSNDNGGGYVYEAHMFGMKSDLDRVELLYTSLLGQAAFGMAAATVPPWEPVATFRRSWLSGFTQAVGRRLAAAEQRATDESGPGTALVLADRTALVEQRMAERYPRIGKAGRRTLAGTGAGAGYQAGERADLGGTHVGGTPRRAVSG